MPTPADALRIRKQHDLLPAGRDAADAWRAEISHFLRKEDDFDLPAGAPTSVCQSAGFPG
jgi:hypothetical protein